MNLNLSEIKNNIQNLPENEVESLITNVKEILEALNDEMKKRTTGFFKAGNLNNVPSIAFEENDILKMKEIIPKLSLSDLESYCSQIQNVYSALLARRMSFEGKNPFKPAPDLNK